MIDDTNTRLKVRFNKNHLEIHHTAQLSSARLLNYALLGSAVVCLGISNVISKVYTGLGIIGRRDLVYNCHNLLVF